MTTRREELKQSNGASDGVGAVRVRDVLTLVVSVVAATGGGCVGSHGPRESSDSGIDAARVLEASLPDASLDVSGADAGRCTPDLVEAACLYTGYHTNCRIPCTPPPGCRFTLRLTWTGGYCCTPGMGDDYYPACGCVDGLVLCDHVWTGSGHEDGAYPTTTCEFCERADAGAAAVDASVPDSS